MDKEGSGASQQAATGALAVPVEPASSLAPSGFDPSRIPLRCTECRSEQMVERDEGDPPNAARAEMACPKCWDGDFDSPEFFDANGEWINPVEHVA